MVEKKEVGTRATVNLRQDANMFALELRHKRELEVGHQVSVVDIVADALREMYAREIKRI